MPKATRLPPPADLDLIGERRTIQVNHCRRPDCDNFAVPARHEKQQTGPSRDRDPAYKVDRAGRGQLPSLRCKSCGEKPPLKSNASIAAEVERLIEADGLRTPLEAVSCPNPDCDNHTLPVAGNVSEGHRRTPAAAYRRAGRSNDGAAPRFQCKRCGRKFSASDPVRLHDRNRRLAADVFGRVANKSPIRGVFRGAGLNSVRSYYPIMEFVRKRCRAHSGAVDRRPHRRAPPPPRSHRHADRRAGVHHQLDEPPRPPQRGRVELRHRGRRKPLHSRHAPQFRRAGRSL